MKNILFLITTLILSVFFFEHAGHAHTLIQYTPNFLSHKVSLGLGFFPVIGMLRERQIQSATITAGTTQLVELSKDAVYHIIQLSCRNGLFTCTQGASGTGAALDENFPFSVIKNLRLLRNGSDVVWQGSGAQLAKEDWMLNENHPFARLFTTTTNVETLLTATVRGITVPANSSGIGSSQAQFAAANAANGTSTVSFQFQMEIWLQMGPPDAYFGTLLDARRLSGFQLEITYAAVADFAIPGTANANTVSGSIQISSYDQDNIDVETNFGTFKRSSQTIGNFPYSTSGQQINLSRGNFWHGALFQTLAQKANSTTVLRQENAVLTLIQNRINTNYVLRQTTFKDLQSKNDADGSGNDKPYAGASGSVQGWGFLYYPAAGDRGSELVPTHVMDVFDLLVTTDALANSENGVTTASTNPTINMLVQEIIPGRTLSPAAPQGAYAGSIARTSAKPYA